MVDLSTIAVVSTVAAYKCDGTELGWLSHGARWASAGATFVLAAEDGQGHSHRLADVIQRVRSLHGVVWRFSLDDGHDTVTSANRLDHIVTGRNLATAAALSLTPQPSHLLYLDTDLTPPRDAIERLLEVNRPVAGGDVPAYCMAREPLDPGYDFPVVRRMNTAGFLLVEAETARRTPWRHDAAHGLTDDPCFHLDTGGATMVRLDVVGTHPPLKPVERRGADLSIRRDPDPTENPGATMPLPETPVAVVIPVHGRNDLTADVLLDLLDQADDWTRVYILADDPQEEDEDEVVLEDLVSNLVADTVGGLPGDSVQVVDATDMSVYEKWNRGWELAESLRPTSDSGLDVLFLNNDVRIPTGFVKALSVNLRAPGTEDVWAVFPDPDAHADNTPPIDHPAVTRTRGTKRHGGLLGHAFMVKGEAHQLGGLPMFDTAYRWWCGDDEFVAQMEARGYTAARVDGLGCDHVNEGTARDHDWTHDAKAQDMALFNQRWPGYPARG